MVQACIWGSLAELCSAGTEVAAVAEASADLRCGKGRHLGGQLAYLY